MGLKIFLSIVIVLLTVVILDIVLDYNRFVLREYTFTSDKLKSDHDFLFLSDQHCKEYGKDNKKLLDFIDSLEVEACLLAGDMMTATPGKNFETAVTLVSELSKRFPLYYSYGNHEYRARLYTKTYGDMFEKYYSKISECGVKLYDNEVIDYGDLNIYAISITKDFYKRFKHVDMSKENVTDLIGDCDESKFSLLLAHNPEYFEAYSKWGADLTLSGHVHGGVIRIPWSKGLLSPKVTFFPKYDGGLFYKNGKMMLVNRGLGNHTLPFRIFNPAEVIVIHLKKC